jgi:hypothetical protein
VKILTQNAKHVASKYQTPAFEPASTAARTRFASPFINFLSSSAWKRVRKK